MSRTDTLSLILTLHKEDAEMSDGDESESDEGDVGDDESFASVDDLDGAH